MYSLGPYYLLPYEGSPLSATQIRSTITIPFSVGEDGIIEVINLSNFNLSVAFDTMGTAFQEARSKVMYRSQQGQIGSQTVTISTPANGVSPAGNRYIRLPCSYQNGETGFLGVSLNIYQAGEVDWAAPVSLTLPPAQSCYFATKNGTAGYTLVLPTTATFFMNVPLTLGTCDLLGFDYTGRDATGAGGGNLTISNLNNQPDGSTTIVYSLFSNSGITQQPLIVRFPSPIPNALGNQITFTVPNLNTAFSTLTAYYSLT